jgi:hypothetical protein
MLQDARIEVDHVGVGEWICNRPQDANMLYQDPARLDNAGEGQLATSSMCCVYLCGSHTDEHYSVVKNRLLCSKYRCLCYGVGKLMNAQHHGFFPHSNRGGWTRCCSSASRPQSADVLENGHCTSLYRR